MRAVCGQWWFGPAPRQTSWRPSAQSVVIAMMASLVPGHIALGELARRVLRLVVASGVTDTIESFDGCARFVGEGAPVVPADVASLKRPRHRFYLFAPHAHDCTSCHCRPARIFEMCAIDTPNR